MPSKSMAQHRLMEGVAHNPGFAKKVGVPQSVGQDFASADRKAKVAALRKRGPSPKVPAAADTDGDGY